MPMKLAVGMLVLSLFGADLCSAQAGDAETEKLRQEAEARQREAEARQRAEMERERQQPRLMQPIYRYPSSSNSAETFMEAARLEQVGKGPEAVKMYMLAARNGSGKAALRLAQIYDKGIPGVARDYALSLRWYSAAGAMGEDVPAKKP
jgi:TPR repeat protein